jgi:SOS response associated peptidase (SRAP)
VFRGALSQRRCIVPADAFYEWKVAEGGKQPYAIPRQDERPMALTGLWESFRWPDETVTRSFTIMTTTPNAEMSELHDRVSVILDQQDMADVARQGRGRLRSAVASCSPWGCCACGRSIVALARRGTMDRSCWKLSPHSATALVVWFRWRPFMARGWPRHFCWPSHRTAVEPVPRSRPAGRR